MTPKNKRRAPRGVFRALKKQERRPLGGRLGLWEGMPDHTKPGYKAFKGFDRAERGRFL